MPNHDASDQRFFILVGSLGIFLLVKFAFFALYVTPLWDIPDEPGHYSYAESLSRGTYPVLGQAHIADNVTRSWLGSDKNPPLNWIAQHPPLYYLLDGPFIAAARSAGMSFDGQVRVARLPSSLFGALAAVGIILFIATATGDKQVGVAAGLFVAATPMLIHLSSGVSHDTLVACMASWSAYFLARWTGNGNQGALYACSVLTGLCVVTKVTALAMAIPLFGVMATRIWSCRTTPGIGESIFRIVKLWIVMFIWPLAWMAYNVVTFGKILPDSSMLGSAQKLVHIGFFQYMTTSLFWQHTLLNYVALIGWNGTGHGTLRWMQANGYIAQVFVGAILFMSMTAAALAIPQKLHIRIRSWWIMAILAVVAPYVVLTHDTMGFTSITCAMIFLALTLLAVALAIRPKNLLSVDLIALASAVCVLFFSLVYYHHLWSGYTGELRATHGRYLYPVLPFIAYAFARPFAGRGVGTLAIVGSLVCLLVSDVYFLRDVSVFYGQF